MEDGTVTHVNLLALHLVEGEAGVSPIAGLLPAAGSTLRARPLAIGEESGIYRFTMVVAGDDQMIKQLLKLVNVLTVQNLSHIPRWSGN